MTDAVDESEDVEEPGDILSLPLPELGKMSDSLLLTDGDKTKRIKELEAEVTSLTHQLTEARNLTNTLYTEIDRYKRVNGQVGWLIEQFRQTISGSDIRKPREPLPPSPPSPSLPLTGVEDVRSQITEDQSYHTESMAEEGDAEDEYSEDWETTEEAEDQTHDRNTLFDGESSDPQDSCARVIGPQQAPMDLFIGPADLRNVTTDCSAPSSSARLPRDHTPLPRAPRDPTPMPSPLLSDPDLELDALLAVATPQTRISEIFRRWCPSTGPPPS